MTDDHELEAALRALRPGVGAADEAVERVMRRLEAAPLPRQKRAFAWPALLTDWNLEPAWPRVAALGCAAMLGLAIGLSGLGTRIATELNLVRVASADESSVFDVDSVAGLRP